MTNVWAGGKVASRDGTRLRIPQGRAAALSVPRLTGENAGEMSWIRSSKEALGRLYVMLPRFYVAAFIWTGGRGSLWMARAAVQRLALKLLSKKWPDVAGYTRAENSRGWASNLRFQGDGSPHFASINVREAQ